MDSRTSVTAWRNSGSFGLRLLTISRTSWTGPIGAFISAGYFPIGQTKRIVRDAAFKPATSCMCNMIGDFALIRELALSCCHYSYCDDSDFFAIRHITHISEEIV